MGIIGKTINPDFHVTVDAIGPNQLRPPFFLEDNMKISKKSPIDRIFVWWYRAKHGNTPFGLYTNLCPYVRAVLFWALPRWVWLSGPERVRVASWTTTICIAEIIGWAPFIIWWDGGEPTPWTWWFVLGIIGALWLIAHIAVVGIGTVALIMLVIEILRVRLKLKKSKPVTALGRLAGDISNLTVGTYTAIHDKVCPTIERTD